MYIPFYIIILIIVYSLIWICGYFVTLFQMADQQVSKEVALRRLKIFTIMGSIEIIMAFYFIF